MTPLERPDAVLVPPVPARGGPFDLPRPDPGEIVAGAEIRPLRRADRALYPAFLARVTDEDRRLRFFSGAALTTAAIVRLTSYDPDSARALIALDGTDGAMLGVARLHRTVPGCGEFAVLVRSDLKGRGLGRELLSRVLGQAGELGIHTVDGLILRENLGMIELARDLGFTVRTDPDDPALVIARRRC